MPIASAELRQRYATLCSFCARMRLYILDRAQTLRATHLLQTRQAGTFSNG